MVIEIVGIKDTKFTSKETGELVEGQTVYFEHDDDNAWGVVTDRCFLSSRKKIVPVPSMPARANLYYNKYGKVDEIIIDK